MNRIYQKTFPGEKNAGFTLIELLVVVLIIGILAAVALPQYERIVLKSKVMNMLPLLRALHDAQERYFLANGTYTWVANLDVDIPADYIQSYAGRDFFWADGTYITMDGLTYTEGDGAKKNNKTVMGGVYSTVGNTGAPKIAFIFYGNYSGKYQNRIICYDPSTIGRQICQSFGGEQIDNNNWFFR